MTIPPVALLPSCSIIGSTTCTWHCAVAAVRAGSFVHRGFVCRARRLFFEAVEAKVLHVQVVSVCFINVAKGEA